LDSGIPNRSSPAVFLVSFAYCKEYIYHIWYLMTGLEPKCKKTMNVVQSSSKVVAVFCEVSLLPPLCCLSQSRKVFCRVSKAFLNWNRASPCLLWSYTRVTSQRVCRPGMEGARKGSISHKTPNRMWQWKYTLGGFSFWISGMESF
jgi:hypothetical protein